MIRPVVGRFLTPYLVLIIALIGLGGTVYAAERITRFDARIAVNADAGITVRETIDVVAEGKDIRRGIYRDIPLRYRDRLGNRRSATIQILSVHRDGRSEPYRVERRGAGVRIYIGDADRYLRPGRYSYELTYASRRQLGHFDDFDEIYWNVTGTGWVFPIEETSATVILPDGAEVASSAAYTGRTGESGQDFETSRPAEGEIRFRTTRTLNPGEGLTVAVSWPPGYVERPTQAEITAQFLRDNAATAAGLIGLLLLLAYFIWVWQRAGRDPQAGVIVPEYAPPEGFSPAACRYVRRMGFDRTAFTAGIVSLAVKGKLRIRENNGEFTLERLGDAPKQPLSAGEKAIWRKLFGGRESLRLKNTNHKTLKAAQKALRQRLENEFERKYFIRNTKYFVPGLALAMAAIVFMVVLSPEPLPAIFMGVWVGVWSIGCYRLFTGIGSAWSGVLGSAGAGETIMKSGGALAATAFALPFLIALIVGLFILFETLPLAVGILMVLVLLTCLAFYHWLKAPTRLGRRILDKIEGFKLYLGVAEKDRMNFHNPPERTPELFERFLPYALALGVEHEWSEQFDDVLARAAAGGEYQPSWYAGRHFHPGHYGDIGNRLGGGFAGALATASAAPRSSGSGSFGGGSVGGGGGGGGGGGW